MEPAGVPSFPTAVKGNSVPGVFTEIVQQRAGPTLPVPLAIAMTTALDSSKKPTCPGPDTCPQVINFMCIIGKVAQCITTVPGCPCCYQCVPAPSPPPVPPPPPACPGPDVCPQVQKAFCVKGYVTGCVDKYPGCPCCVQCVPAPTSSPPPPPVCPRCLTFGIFCIQGTVRVCEPSDVPGCPCCPKCKPLSG